jgi:hypothetical protein
VVIPNSEIRNPNFDWRVFADATCAGLSVLVPLPLVDLVFETVFRRRIPGTISRLHRRPIEPAVRRGLGRSLSGTLSVSSCLTVPFAIGRYVLRRVWRKIIYVYAVKDSTTALTEYWHRAFLIDHMVRAGHLEAGVDTDLAVRTFERTLRELDPSPLMGLARLTVANVGHVFRLLVRARRLGAAEVTRSLGELLASHWRAAEASMRGAASRYNELYRLSLEARHAGAPSIPGT